MKSLESTYKGYYCTECDSVCHYHDQGLTCSCGAPWENERVLEDSYPDKWEPVLIHSVTEIYSIDDTIPVSLMNTEPQISKAMIDFEG